MRELRQQFALPLLLRAAELARSTFFYHQKAQRAEDKHACLKSRVRALFHQHKGRYGYRRITAAVRREGTRVNHKTIQRLMSEMQLKCRIRAKKYRSYLGDVGHVAGNILQRNFAAQRPNQKWVTDVTEFKIGSQKLYLSPILDLFNGEIISYEIARRPLFSMVNSMLDKAFSRLTSQERPLLHSDQGWQYQMPIYRRLLKQRAVTMSMSRKGNCLDNASMESFFGTLKTEFFYTQRFRSIDEMKNALTDYIHYYNHDRIKLKLGASPVQYRLEWRQR